MDGNAFTSFHFVFAVSAAWGNCQDKLSQYDFSHDRFYPYLPTEEGAYCERNDCLSVYVESRLKFDPKGNVIKCSIYRV